jgi:hypothetical protein
MQKATFILVPGAQACGRLQTATTTRNGSLIHTDGATT